MNPSVEARNLVPTSIAFESDSVTVVGVWAVLKSEHGHPAGTVTVTLPAGCSTLPLSSVARLMSVNEPAVCGIQENVQFSRPAARRQVAPPSTDNSTAATVPPPASAAVPDNAISISRGTVAPLTGEL